MDLYSWIKLLHILSATVLFGTGIGTAFFMLTAHLSGSEEAMRVTTINVVRADWVFTTPAVVAQLGTGLWLTWQLGIPFDSVWFATVLALFVFVGLCWIPVVWIQIRIKTILAQGGRPADYQGLMRVWISLGIPAFAAVLVLFYLMVVRVGVGTTILD